MKIGVALVVAVACALALSACGSETQAAAVRGWMNSSAFTSNSITLRTDIAHSEKAVTDASAPATELHTVCAILYADAASANASLPTPDNVALSELSRAYVEMAGAADTCYVAWERPALKKKATTQLTLAGQELALATLELNVAGNVESDASATRAWVKETKLGPFVTTTDAAIARNVAYLSTARSPAVDAAFCRSHPVAAGAAASLLPSPDAQSTTLVTTALTSIATANADCASARTSTTVSSRRVVADAISQFRHAAADLYFAVARIQIASGAL